MFSFLSVPLLSVFLAGALADPDPGRIPKVYNALITSNQNLEPSKAYPVYQPVLHDPFPFSYQPSFFYGGDLYGNTLLPHSSLSPKDHQSPELTQTTSSSPPASPESSTLNSVKTPELEKPSADKETQSAIPDPPKTESPILLNSFGLPPQVLPLGHIDPVFNTLPQFNPFSYPYPTLRYYDPYDPFSYSFPSLYRPFHNVLGHPLSVVPIAPAAADKKAENVPTSTEPSDKSPPPAEPSDLNILNYSSKDPAIPNVPPPPLPQGGLKSDKSE